MTSDKTVFFNFNSYDFYQCAKTLITLIGRDFRKFVRTTISKGLFYFVTQLDHQNLASTPDLSIPS